MPASLWDPVTAPLLPAGGDEAALPKFHQVFRGTRVHACVNLEIPCNYCSQRSASRRKVPVPRGNRARGSPKTGDPRVNGFCQDRAGADGAGRAPADPTCARSERGAQGETATPGTGKVREKQNIEIYRPSTGRWLPGQLRFLFSGRMPCGPSTSSLPMSLAVPREGNHK